MIKLRAEDFEVMRKYYYEVEGIKYEKQMWVSTELQGHMSKLKTCNQVEGINSKIIIWPNRLQDRTYDEVESWGHQRFEDNISTLSCILW